MESAIQSGTVDPARMYLAGRGDAAAAVFYTISRVPDLWAAGAALGGSPKAAIDTNASSPPNFTNVPVLWISGDDGKPMAEKLSAAKLNVECQSAAAGANAAALLKWLAGTSARGVSAGDRLRNQLADLCALLLDPTGEVRRQ